MEMNLWNYLGPMILSTKREIDDPGQSTIEEKTDIQSSAVLQIIQYENREILCSKMHGYTSTVCRLSAQGTAVVKWIKKISERIV